MKKFMTAAMMMAITTLAAGEAVAAAAPAAAPVAEPGIGLTLKAGTTGVGGDLTVGLTENFNLRAGISYFTWTQKGVGGDTDKKDLQLDLLNVPLTVDWHPITGNGFRISAGVMFNNDRGELNARYGQSVSINDHDYIVSSLNGKIDFNRFGPYLGIGYGNAADTSARWHFSSDLGVAYIGAPNITLEATALDPAQQGALENDLAAQRKTYEDDAKPFKFYPVLTIGVSYTF